ncbi:MAG: hypothetical protein IJC46_05310 [Clostridia bacterium]|nr:hypothetical protein [Clostridia bacterium]
MFLFKSKAQRELDFILQELKNFLSNNYKDAAHDCRKMLGEKAEEYYQAGKLSKPLYRKYKEEYRKYTELMKDYHH